MITLVLGGARSGKSALAERLTMAYGAPVTYLATAVVDPGDADLVARIAAHRSRRPSGWRTVECGADLPAALAGITGSVLVDALGTWVAAAPDFAADSESLCAVLRRRKGDSVIVSDEVGLGVHPSTGAGVRFRDVLGRLNVEVAEVADEVLLVVAGRALRLQAADTVTLPTRSER
ncbi:MAG: bifunctional adenosylcobinamide kinase/adenosylcobinamide-phosphate guanylyltransferase [Acidimicrobiales bacterium]